MGLMDRAKKMAEQAQAKLDEVQSEVNASQSSRPAASGPVVEYDEHGRPLPPSEPAPAASVAPPSPAPPAPPVAAAAPRDRNFIDYTPPKLTSGDPLAGG
jgi:hypothetical protein